MIHENKNINDIIFTNIGNALHAADVNRIVAIADEIWDTQFELSGTTGWRQSDINQYLLEHGGGGGGVDPQQVISIITTYLNERLKGINGISVSVTPLKTTISLDYFDGGEINIE